GDTGGQTIYPGTSPFVVSAGGTSLQVDAAGNRLGETGWNGSGGGQSVYESRPSYQNGVSAIVGSARRGPGRAFDADPAPGVSVYDSTSCQGLSGWLVFGGTSVASPSLAGIVSSAGHALSSTDELTQVYGSVSNGGGTINPVNFFDITGGTAGAFTATT